MDVYTIAEEETNESNGVYDSLKEKMWIVSYKSYNDAMKAIDKLSELKLIESQIGEPEEEHIKFVPTERVKSDGENQWVVQDNYEDITRVITKTTLR